MEKYYMRWGYYMKILMRLFGAILLLQNVCFAATGNQFRSLVIINDSFGYEAKHPAAVTMDFLQALQEKIPTVVNDFIAKHLVKAKTDSVIKTEAEKVSAGIAAGRSYLYGGRFAGGASRYGDIPETVSDFIFPALLKFDSSEWYIYHHAASGLMLFMPITYVDKLTKSSDADERLKAYGFNVGKGSGFLRISFDDFIAKDIIQQTPASMIAAYNSMFNDQAKRVRWLLWMGGHGGPGHDDEPASSAGFSFPLFEKFINDLNNNTNIAFFFYFTCFSGGRNQLFVSEMLGKIKANFLVASMGVGEKDVVSAYADDVIADLIAGRGVMRAPFSFATFFEKLRLYFGAPEEFVKSLVGVERQMDPLAVILRYVQSNDTMNSNTQPFVRVPHVGTFGAIDLDKKIEQLTAVKVKARELEKKEINLVDKHAVMIYAPSIGVPLTIRNTDPYDYTEIVMREMPVVTNGTTTWRTNPVYRFKKITTDANLNSFISTLLQPNLGYETVYLIDRLECSNCPGCVEGDVAKRLVFENVIITVGEFDRQHPTHCHFLATYEGTDIENCFQQYPGGDVDYDDDYKSSDVGAAAASAPAGSSDASSSSSSGFKFEYSRFNDDELPEFMNDTPLLTDQERKQFITDRNVKSLFDALTARM